MKYTREEILTVLQEGEVIVEFTKVNGELRKMPCTLKAELLPIQVEKVTEAKVPRKENLEVVRAFCTDKQSWRSFRIDSVITITK